MIYASTDFKIRHPYFSDSVCQALAFASEAHDGQFRLDGKTEFIAHPEAVVDNLYKSPWRFSQEELQGAALHDVIEDAYAGFKPAERFRIIANSFGDDVAAIVYLLSKPEEKFLSRKIYRVSLLRMAPAIIAIKCADQLANIQELSPDPTWNMRFMSRVYSEIPDMVNTIKMHGSCWWQYTTWIVDHVNDRLSQFIPGYVPIVA